MIERYQGSDGEALLVEALRGQRFIEGREDLAGEFAKVGILEEFTSGETFITQGASDNDLYLIISGKAAVMVNGRKVNERRGGQHVGEMALIDPAAHRSASLVAETETVTLRVQETAFTKIANTNPRVWRSIAVELADRLRQRNDFVRAPNDKPHIFIGSSGEALPVARALRKMLEAPEVVVKLWTDGVFDASEASMESLEKTAQLMDFAVLVFNADDKVFSREHESDAPRDNVIFELGLFMGALGRNRTFMVVPKGVDLKIPSDLLGITQLRFDDGTPDTLEDRLLPVSEELRHIVWTKGPK